jgi:hypothetical protein
MPKPSEQISNTVGSSSGEQQMYSAVVSNDALSPSDEVWVTVPDFDEGVHKFGPVVWKPVVNDKGIFYPKKDAACLISKPDPTLKIWMPEFEEAEEPDVVQASGLLDTEGLGVIIVEDNEEDETPRPKGFAHRWWFAHKAPKEAVLNDIWTRR